MATDPSHDRPRKWGFRAIKAASLALALLGVASCATMVPHEEATSSLQKAHVCCESMAEFEYDQLGEGVRFNLDVSSAAFKVPAGKSYFKAFRLPVRELPYRIKIRSFALGEHVSKAHVFFPQVALLDERFDFIRQSAPADFVLTKTDVKEAAAETGGLPIKLEGSVLVDDPKAKYVVVYTTDELLARSTPYETQRVVPVIVPGLVTALPGGKETLSIRHSPFGLLHIETVPAAK